MPVFTRHTATVPDHPPYRLPRTVEPTRYELTLAPDLEAATFTGEQRVQVTVHEPVDEFVLNALDLQVLSADITDDAGTITPATVTYREDEQQVVLGFDRDVGPGEFTLTTTFTGELNDKLVGFYRSTFTDDSGTDHVIATTQFEATDARRAFPCWDEPDFKAVFAVTLVVDRDLTALSNGGAVEEIDLGNGKKQVTFAETIRMSTYLVAFVVGPLELSAPADVDGVPLRVACVPGKIHLAEFAKEAGAFSLRFFTEWFGLPYPGDKLDLVAIPDFAFGAMENLGCVTFRENALLVDPEAASQLELQRIADVVSHEIAHMWFGDLVTMKWWNGVWLNEAFATFMELKCVDAFRPQWERWTAFAAERAGALVTDGLAATRPVEYTVQRPEEADGMFDVLTYQKGAGVVRMLEQYVGEEPFRQSIAQYIKDNSYANTETTDLWDAIEAGTGEQVRAAMDTWIFQGGYPLLLAELGHDERTLELSQTQFRYDGSSTDARWQVPVTLRVHDGVDGDDEPSHARVMLRDEAASVPLGDNPSAVVVNSGGWGFFRVRYAPALAAPLRGIVGSLTPIERYNLVSDTWAAALAARADAVEVLDLVEEFTDEDDPDVWDLMVGIVRVLAGVVGEGGRDALERFVRRLAGPRFERLGWEAAADEPPRTATARGHLVDALGTIGADPAVRDRAAELHERYLADPAILSGDLAGPVTRVVAATAGEAEYTTFLDRVRNPSTPQEEMRYLWALAEAPHPAQARRTVDLCLSEIRSQNAPLVIRRTLLGPVGAHAWSHVEKNWDALMERIPTMLWPRLLEGITGISDPDVSGRIRTFLADHPVPQGQKTVDQHVERMGVLVRFRQRQRDALLAALDGR